MRATSYGVNAGIVSLLSVVFGCSSTVDDDHSDTEAHWGYSGAEGPEYWGSLSEEYARCETGEYQSPVNFPAELPANALDDLEFDYAPTSASLVDNGHTIVVEFGENENTILVDGKAHHLLQFHFHADSEHRVEGEAYPLELHLVHKADDGALAVVGLFFEEGEENEALDEVFSTMSSASVDASPLEESIDLMSLVPEEPIGWTYSGSLTTPPCTEGVAWNVVSTPLSASADQIESFTALHSGSYRPVEDNEDVDEQLEQAGGSESDS